MAVCMNPTGAVYGRQVVGHSASIRRSGREGPSIIGQQPVAVLAEGATPE